MVVKRKKCNYTLKASDKNTKDIATNMKGLELNMSKKEVL